MSNGIVSSAQSLMEMSNGNLQMSNGNSKSTINKVEVWEKTCLRTQYVWCHLGPEHFWRFLATSWRLSHKVSVCLHVHSKCPKCPRRSASIFFRLIFATYYDMFAHHFTLLARQRSGEGWPFSEGNIFCTWRVSPVSSPPCIHFFCTWIWRRFFFSNYEYGVLINTKKMTRTRMLRTRGTFKEKHGKKKLEREC